jgi:hypothetical protein
MKAGRKQVAVFRTGLVRLYEFFGAWRHRRVGPKPLRLSTPRVGIFRTMFLICGLAPPSIAAAQNGPFSAYAGSWTGNGVVTASNGNSERIRCRAHYSVLQSDTDLNQHLRCASDSYHFDVNSVLLADSEGRIRGTWEETTRRASGSVSGQLAGAVVTGHVTGTGFTAEITVTLRGDRQSVQLKPTGTEIALVAVELRRE